MLRQPEIGGSRECSTTHDLKDWIKSLEMQLISQFFFFAGGGGRGVKLMLAFILLPNRLLPSNSFFGQK